MKINSTEQLAYVRKSIQIRFKLLKKSMKDLKLKTMYMPCLSVVISFATCADDDSDNTDNPNTNASLNSTFQKFFLSTTTFGKFVSQTTSLIKSIFTTKSSIPRKKAPGPKTKPTTLGCAN